MPTDLAIIQLLQSGNTPAEIADAHQMPMCEIYTVAKRHGFPVKYPRKMAWTWDGRSFIDREAVEATEQTGLSKLIAKNAGPAHDPQYGRDWRLR